MTLVVDASVALKWYVETPQSAAAAEVLARGELLIAPDLVVAEVSNAAWKLARAGHIETDHGTQIVAAIGIAFSKLVPSTELANRAFALAIRLDHPVYDCLYLALAELERAALVTADQRLLKRLKQARWKGNLLPLD